MPIGSKSVIVNYTFMLYVDVHALDTINLSEAILAIMSHTLHLLWTRGTMYHCHITLW